MTSEDAEKHLDTCIGKSFEPVTLPCGRIIRNRFVKVLSFTLHTYFSHFTLKAALYENFASLFGGPPNALHTSLYTQWSTGGWGMIITGNVQISKTHLTLGHDCVVPRVLTKETIAPFARLAAAIHGTPDDRDTQPLAIMQLSHTGRQAANFIGGRFPFFPPLAPSATRVGAKCTDGVLARILYRLAFQTAREMTVQDIDDVVNGFVRGAKLALDSGFDGVQLHASHGCK